MDPIPFLQALILDSDKRQAVLEKAKLTLKYCLIFSTRMLIELFD
jgi:hypothetical protein